MITGMSWTHCLSSLSTMRGRRSSACVRCCGRSGSVRGVLILTHCKFVMSVSFSFRSDAVRVPCSVIQSVPRRYRHATTILPRQRHGGTATPGWYRHATAVPPRHGSTATPPPLAVPPRHGHGGTATPPPGVWMLLSAGWRSGHARTRVLLAKHGSVTCRAAANRNIPRARPAALAGPGPLIGSLMRIRGPRNR